MLAPTTAVLRTSRPQALTYEHAGNTLPEMYRRRWADSDDASLPPAVKEDTHPDIHTSDILAAIVGASMGVGLTASLGAFKSVALMPTTFALLNDAWGFGGAYDMSTFMDSFCGWVATSNQVFLPVLGVAADFVVLTSIVALIVLRLDELSKQQGTSEELCLLTETPACGPTSFDSTEGYACVEQSVNGQVRWVCA
jgi:hypothetical protein